MSSLDGLALTASLAGPFAVALAGPSEPSCLVQLPSDVAAVVSDACCEGCSGPVQVVADDFVLTGAVTAINVVRWWGGYAPDGTVPFQDHFTIAVWSDADGLPGTLIRGDAVTAERLATGGVIHSAGGVPQYVYSTVPVPALLLPPGRYWMEIYNETPDFPCPWDCGDGNGVVDAVDFLALLGEWGQVGAACDVDGDGVGAIDFLELLGHWGPCPPGGGDWVWESGFADVGVNPGGVVSTTRAGSEQWQPLAGDLAIRFDCHPLCGALEPLLGVEPQTRQLFLVDAATGLAEPTVVIDGTGPLTEIEFDPLGGVIYVTTGGGTSQVLTVDPASGTVISTAGQSVIGAINGLEFAGTLLGTLVAGGGGGEPSMLVSVDPATGLVAPIGPTGVANIGGLAFDLTCSILYGITSGQSAVPPDLLTLDPATGAVLSSVATDIPDEVSSLEFAQDGRLIGAGADGILYEIDTVTGAGTVVGPLVNAGKLSGLSVRGCGCY